MRRIARTAAVGALVALLSTTSLAQVPDEPPFEPPPPISPRLALTAALINVVYLPLRVALTGVTAVVGGLTGFMTGGNQEASDAVFGLTNGPQVITPAMLDGRERWHLGEYD
jgi:hypothetical protein